MHRLLPALLFLIFAAACHAPGKTDTADAPGTDTAEKRNFFPVLDILKSEMATVDSTPYRIMLYHQRDGRKDSVLLKQGEFDAQAKAFLLPGLDSASLARRFTESSFLDQSSGMLTFTYSTHDSLFGLRRVDVLAEPSLSDDKVRTIYLEFSAKDSDTLRVKRMTWIAGKYFNITESIHPPKGNALIRETKVVWNNG